MSRRLAWAMTAAVGLPVLSLGGIFGLSELRLQTYEPPPVFSTPVPEDSASLARGRHLARTRGCFGCHGQALEGHVFEDEWPWVERAVAPNLALHARAHDDQTLADAIRSGVGQDGRALWSMPSYNFKHLPDEDLAALIGFLRAADVVEGSHPKPRLGWKARWWIATGREDHMANWASAVPSMLLRSDDDEVLVRGEQLAMTTCNECHGLDLRGAWADMGVAPPDLAMVAGYPWEDFQRLMKTGVPIGGRDLGLMGLVARDRFAYFTDRELADLYAFLGTLPDRPVPENVFWRPDR